MVIERFYNSYLPDTCRRAILPREAGQLQL